MGLAFPVAYLLLPQAPCFQLRQARLGSEQDIHPTLLLLPFSSVGHFRAGRLRAVKGVDLKPEGFQQPFGR